MSGARTTAQDWQRLRELAIQAMEQAYAPYSRFRVGAAALVDDGRLVSGCNVENAGYGVTLCAECGLVSELVRTGGGRLLAFAVLMDGFPAENATSARLVLDNSLIAPLAACGCQG